MRLAIGCADSAARRPAGWRRWQPVLAALCLPWMLHAAPAAAAESGAYRVEISAPEPLKKLLEAHLDIVRWSKRADVTPERIDQLFRTAADQVKEILATEGYFSAQVEATFAKQKDGEVARFVVDPGEPARVTRIDLNIVGAVTRAADAQARIDRARRAFRIKPGDVFRQADWNAAKERVVRDLARRVYATARIESSKAQIDPAAHSAALQLEVDSGPPVTVGKATVNGLQRYPLALVVNLNPISAGAPYDEDELLKYQRRLLATGYFASAVVSAQADPSSPNNTALEVKLVEAPARRVELGAGYSTDRGLRGQIDYSDKNLFDRAWKLSTNLYADRLSQQVTGGIEFPRHADGWNYGLEAKLKNEDIEGQRITNWSVTGAHVYTVEEYQSSLSLQFLTERSTLQDGTKDNRQALFLNQGWTWNGLDDLLNPRQGYIAKLNVGGASEDVLSSATFGRVYGKASYLLPFDRRWSLGLRAEAGVVLADSRQGIPSAYVFRTGGDATIRGYAFESLGVAEGDSVVGGRYLALGSVEVTRWIVREWGVAVFYDTGNAFDDVHSFNPVAGYGGGVHWRSPIGNLALDLAYGEETRKWRLHFNAGFAFR